MNKNIFFLGGMGIGAGLMYLLDPDKGRRRRALVRDAADHAVRVTDRAIGKTTRDFENRVHGVAAELGGLFHREECHGLDDQVLEARVRSQLGRIVSHPHAVSVEANQGRITLSGHILAKEVGRLIKRAWAVPGVTCIESKLEVHKEAGKIPSLQEGIPHAGEMPELFQSNWSPAIRLLMGIGGGALVTYAARRKDLIGAAIGLGLLTRGLTNMEVQDLFGLNGSRGISVQKTITVNAPVKKVFQELSRPENYPHFMSHVREVKNIGDEKYHWTVAGPAGVPVEWEAVITKLEPERLLAWQSVPDSKLAQQGVIRFLPDGENKTVVDIKLSYHPPAGAIGHAIAALLGADPKSEMDDDLMRMKSFIETGHQPHDAAERLARQAAAG